MSDTVYCYPGTDVLKNKLNIQNADRLLEAERKLTMLRLLELLEHPVTGAFDYEHLKAIHGYIFQDIYDWAGQERVVDIAKGNMFCSVRFITEQADILFAELKADKYLANLPKESFIKKLAYYLSEINALHPFREGNGRTQREFIRALAIKNGYQIKFANVSEKEMIKASQASFLRDYTLMEKLLAEAIQ